MKSKLFAIWGIRFQKLLPRDNFLLFIFFLGFYAIFSAREPLWGDSAKLSLYVLENDFGERSLAAGMGQHTLLILIGRCTCDLFGLSPHRALSLISAVCGAGTISLMQFLLQRIGASRISSILCSISLAFASSSLFIFTVQESYGLLMLLWLGTLICFHHSYENDNPDARVSFLIGILLGLSMLNHTLSVMMFGSALLPFLYIKHSIKKGLYHSGIAIVGLLIVMCPVYYYFMTPNTTPEPFLTRMNTYYNAFMNPWGIPKGIVLFVLWLGFQLPIISTIAAISFMKIRTCNIKYLKIHLAFILTVVLFTSTYMIQRRILMMTICLPSVLIIVAQILDQVMIKNRQIMLALMPVIPLKIAFYVVFANVLSDRIPDFIPEYRVNHWRTADYYFAPFKYLSSNPSRLRDELDDHIAKLQDNEHARILILSDFTFVKPLIYYHQNNHWRPEIEIIELDFLYKMKNESDRIAGIASIIKNAADFNTSVIVVPYPDKVLKRLPIEDYSDFVYFNEFAELREKQK